MAALTIAASPAFAQSADLAQPAEKTLALVAASRTSVPLGDAQSIALLHDNGPIQTGTGDGAGGANTSAVQSQYGSTMFGAVNNAATQTYIAEDITVPTGGWTVSDMEFFAFQTDSSPSTSPIMGLFVQIWNGIPGATGSTVVFGDLTTNRLVSSTFSGIYRVGQGGLTDARRPIYRNTATVVALLPAGTYYVVWGTTGSLASDPFAPIVSVPGLTQPPPGNALWFNGTSVSPILDGANGTLGGMTPVEVPFLIHGPAGTPTGPTLYATPSVLAFGAIQTGTAGAAQTVTLSNIGTAATTITAITGSGAPFAVDLTGTSLTLAPGASTTFTVAFAPTIATAATGTVTIVSSAPTSPLVVNLMGRGFVPPPNDDSADATPITTTAGTFTGSNFDAVLEPGEPTASCQAATGASVWWTYTPVQSGLISVDLSESDFDTVLTLHQPGTTELDCDDDGSEGTNPVASVLTDVLVAAGSPVLIRVAGFNGFGTREQGAVSFTFSFVGNTAGEGSADVARTYLTASPNPVRGTSSVRFASATAQEVTVSVYDVTGRQVATLFQGAVAADQQVDLALDASSLAPGVYVVRLRVGGDVRTRRMTVIR